jgi:hypothetical protein
MRALLDEDYAAHKHTIFMHQSIYARPQPNVHFYVEFDYSRGSARVECKPFMDIDARPPSAMRIDWEVLHADAQPRAIRSAGRMELYAMTDKRLVCTARGSSRCDVGAPSLRCTMGCARSDRDSLWRQMVSRWTSGSRTKSIAWSAWMLGHSIN